MKRNKKIEGYGFLSLSCYLQLQLYHMRALSFFLFTLPVQYLLYSYRLRQKISVKNLQSLNCYAIINKVGGETMYNNVYYLDHVVVMQSVPAMNWQGIRLTLSYPYQGD